MESVALARVVAVVDAVGATSSRHGKVAALSELLAEAAPTDVVPLVGLLRAQPRQGRLGVGWRAGVNVGYMNITHKSRWLPF